MLFLYLLQLPFLLIPFPSLNYLSTISWPNIIYFIWPHFHLFILYLRWHFSIMPILFFIFSFYFHIIQLFSFNLTNFILPCYFFTFFSYPFYWYLSHLLTICQRYHGPTLSTLFDLIFTFLFFISGYTFMMLFFSHIRLHFSIYSFAFYSLCFTLLSIPLRFVHT